MPTDPISPPDQRDGAPSVYDDHGMEHDSALDAFVQPMESEPVDPTALLDHDVTAILVAHNGERWLPRTLAAVAASDRAPDQLIAVDTGSRDSTADLLGAALGAHSVVTLPASTGFGAAVQAGIDAADDRIPEQPTWHPQVEWIWLLHDDCAPAPDALRRLLEYAVRRPEAGVIGPKVRSWRDERQLLEVGLSISGGGRRQTGLEKREYDQGQHDATREVLAVGSAGMLVRRDVWDELGGFDPRLPIFRDDIDFGWRANLAGHPVVVHPDAIVQHAEAAAHGRRRLGATRDRAHLVDRRNALYVLLANAPASHVPFVYVRILLGGLSRALGFLFGKQPALAGEELLAVLGVLARPDRVFRARRRRAKARAVEPAALRPFFPTPTQQLRNAGETVLALVTGSGSGSGYDLPDRRRAASGSSEDDDEPVEHDSVVLKVLLRPGVLLIAGLAVLALIASRDLIGAGRLTGGALLPAPDSPPDLWSTYTQSWHGVGLGSPTVAPPYLAAVAALGTVLRSPSLAVDLLLIGSVPLAGLTAYLLVRRLIQSRWIRVWAAGTYALLPATTGAIAAGRLGTAAAIVLTPLVALATARTLGRPGDHGPFRAAWSAGLLLAVTAAFVPLAWVAALILAGIGIATAYRDRGSVLRMLAVLSVAPVVLMPWTGQVLREPVLLVTEAGTPGPDLSDSALQPWAILLQHPGGPGAGPVLLGVGVVLAGWGALLRGDRRLAVLAGWAVAGTALVLGVVVSRLPVTGPTLEVPVAGWPGYPAALVGGGLLAAGAIGAERLRDRLSGASFGWRQPLAVVVVAAAVGCSLLAAGWWLVRGADEPLERRDPAVLPAYVAEEAARPERVRTLVLTRGDDGRVTYALLRRSGPRLGDAETGPPPQEYAALDQVVGDLVSDRGGAEASALAPFAARYIYLPAPADPGLVDVLDSVPGLTRASAPEGAVMWQVAGPIGRVRVLGGPDGPVVVPSGEVEASGVIAPETGDRELVLAERADPGWRATVAGEPLDAVTVDDWSQAFALPATGGDVEISHRGSQRSAWLTAQLIAVLIAIVLALPGIRRERGAVDDAADVDSDDPLPPELPSVPMPVPAPPGELVTAASSPANPARPGRRRAAEPGGDERAEYVGRRTAGRGNGGSRAANTADRPAGGRRAKGRRQQTGNDS
jgi:GT2 family glycosyltransferase